MVWHVRSFEVVAPINTERKKLNKLKISNSQTHQRTEVTGQATAPLTGETGRYTAPQLAAAEATPGTGGKVWTLAEELLVCLAVAHLGSEKVQGEAPVLPGPHTSEFSLQELYPVLREEGRGVSLWSRHKGREVAILKYAHNILLFTRPPSPPPPNKTP